MASDFKASQVQTRKLIVSGTTQNLLLVYPISAQDAGSPNQGLIDLTKFSTASIGTDVFLYVSGTAGGRGGSIPTVSVFGGDVHVSGNISVAGGPLTAGVRFSQALDKSVTGITFENAGAVYLPVGTLQTPARIFGGATTGSGDIATVELRRETGGTLLATWGITGTLQEMTQSTPISIPASDWYNIRLKASGETVVAVLKGIDWLVQV